MSVTDSFEHRLVQYRKLEAKIKELADEHKKRMEPFSDAREKLRAHLLDMLNKSGQDSAKTTAGTVYKTTKQSASLDNPEQFKRHVIGSENWDLLDWKANITAVMDFALQNEGQLPPGVKITQKLDIGVRAPVNRKANGAAPSSADEAEAGEAAPV